MRAVDIHGNHHEVSLDEISWRVHAYAVIIEDDKILLSPQHGDNRYDLPGGKVDLGESMEDGLVREVKEETGIEVSPVRLLGVHDVLFKVTFREPQEVWHSVMLYYLCDKVGGRINTDGFDEHEASYAQEAVWMNLDQLDGISPASSYDWREIIRQV